MIGPIEKKEIVHTSLLSDATNTVASTIYKLMKALLRKGNIIKF